MSTRTLFPYRSLVGGITVEMLSAPQGFHLDDVNRRLIRIEDPGSVIEVQLRLTAPLFELSSCLPAGTDPVSLSELGVRSIGRASRFRRFDRPIEGAIVDAQSISAEVIVRLDVAECRGKIEIEPLLLLAREVEPSRRVDGLAYARSSVIATGESWELILDLEEPPPGRGLPIRWVPFSERFANTPDQHSDLFALDPEPCILLNSDKDGLHETLHSKATHGPIARVRDMVNHQIVLQGWTSLIGSSIASYLVVMTDDPDMSPFEILEELSGWQRAVIREWAPYLARNASADEALSVLHDLLAQRADLMIDEVPRAIQTRFGTSKSFDGMMTEFANRLGGDSGE